MYYTSLGDKTSVRSPHFWSNIYFVPIAFPFESTELTIHPFTFLPVSPDMSEAGGQEKECYGDGLHIYYTRSGNTLFDMTYINEQAQVRRYFDVTQRTVNGCCVNE